MFKKYNKGKYVCTIWCLALSNRNLHSKILTKFFRQISKCLIPCQVRKPFKNEININLKLDIKVANIFVF